jgi:nucleoside phosphorylase
VFDTYSWQARLAPVLIAALPLVLLWSVALSRLTFVGRVAAPAVPLALAPLLDQFGRARGRRLEPSLFAAWGGRPTTQLLRWHGTADESRQAARHRTLQRITGPGTRLPTPEEEQADPVAADEAYAAAVRILRTLTAADASAPLVVAENRNYGFRRNLLGLKPWGISLTCISLAATLALTGSAHGWPAASLPVLVAAADVALLVIWLAVVRGAWVRDAAWIYAERLIDHIDWLDAVSQLPPAGPADPAHADPTRPTVAILTALSCEFAAVTAVLRQGRPLVSSPPGDPNQYHVGELPSRDPAAPHQVVTTVLPHDGNRTTAAVTTDLLRSFPTIRCIVFSGIAGGVPDPQQPGQRVWLGDVLVAVDGIVDYDHTRTVDGAEHLRRQLHGLSADMLRAVQELRASHRDPGVSLEPELARVSDPRFTRPDESRAGSPAVHFGAIGSADRVLRDAPRRDQLASMYNIKGVEMEASGLAVGASLRNVPWFVVRGVADYCDNAKNDAWHNYAAMTSAALVAVVLSYCRPLGPERH